MRISDSTLKRTAWTMAAMAVLLVVATVFSLLRDGSNDSPGVSGFPSSSEAPASVSPDDSTTEDSPTALSGANPFGSSDPFSKTFGSATKIYEVHFQASSDSSLRQLAYQFRDGKKGTAHLVPVTPGSWTMNRSIKGPRYVAELAVQVYPPATRATCTIFLNGRKIVSKTAKGAYHVAVCIA